ncbi:MAG: hypothetical protein Q6K80_05040 [Thermostichus sp. DG_1_6_bins_120]
MDPAAFLECYRFELEQQSGQAWIERWSATFPRDWIPAALLEALYQGRYKATSVEQILRFWQRRGCPRITFSPEMSQSLWREQQELIRSLALAARTAIPRPYSPLTTQIPSPVATGSLFSPESAISLNVLLEQLQELPPKLRHLLNPSVPLTRTASLQPDVHPLGGEPSDDAPHCCANL